ncbi:hypothetical protein H9Q72_013068 [Fusarium xylarioides]|uniref:Uncharacterized protein n=1 Tax=Fusarium xylarioides TaxID=221167 RepID=A0A9P7HFU8_9HYPO|nr:hypothetical protein H9Q72_013068 [Fusarium xylarioides]
MELQASVPTSYDLTPSHFAEQISQPGKDTDWRHTQVCRVLSSFEDAKKVMLEDGIKMIFDYLEDGRWIDDGAYPTDHLVYRRFMGRKGGDNETPTLFYPEFFVIQAIFGVGVFKVLNTVKQVYQVMSEHWGVDITPEKFFYPRLDDSIEEHLLMLGTYKPQFNMNTSHVAPYETKGDGRDTNLQLRALQRQNVELRQQVQEQDEHQQLVQSELQDALRQLDATHQYANRLEDNIAYLQHYIGHHQHVTIEVQEINE